MLLSASLHRSTKSVRGRPVPKVTKHTRLLALLDEACPPLGRVAVGRVALGGLEIGELAGRLCGSNVSC